MNDGEDNSLSPETQQGKINEVRKLIGPQSRSLALYCSDACIARYLRARSWNVKKAVRMLKATLKWRSDYKPEEIRWVVSISPYLTSLVCLLFLTSLLLYFFLDDEDVAVEAETGKIYRSTYKDKYGRPVLVMRPRCQNTKSIKGQIKYLVYCMENAILNLEEGQEQMVWLIDFHGFSLSNVSIKVTKETAHVLQDHYPERLGVAILYDPPKIFEPFWKMAKPFLEAKTTNKVKFVYSNDPTTNKIMDELFDMEVVESAFGGKDEQDFDINKYAERMKDDDKKLSLLWRTHGSLLPSPPPYATNVVSPKLDTTSSDTDSEASDIKATKPISTSDEDDGTIPLPPKHE